MATYKLTEDSPISIEAALPEGSIEDEITGRALKETAKEIVRQRLEHALVYEYGIQQDDMTIDFPARSIKGPSKAKKVDIAVFKHGKPHSAGWLVRAVICRPEPKQSQRAIRIRDYEQAHDDLRELEELMLSVPSCELGLWTNGLEYFYVKKVSRAAEVDFEPIGDWPLAEGAEDGLGSGSFMRPAGKEMLRGAFRRCHNYIHGNEGMPKDAAFWQFLYVIFCKLYDEDQVRKRLSQRRFFVSAGELFKPEGRSRIRARIDDLFRDVKATYGTIFRGNEEITLSDRALEFMVMELSKYDLGRTDMDAKGVAYQEIVGNNLRGDRGQYFTPRGVIDLAVQILDPKPTERILDPACGTGGFLVAALGYQRRRFEQEEGVDPITATMTDYLPVLERIRAYAEQYVFGCDFDPFLIKASQMNMVMAGDGRGHLFHINSLEFPGGYLEDVGRAEQTVPLGSVDVLLTNPPFGSDIPVMEKSILQQYELAKVWEPAPGHGFRTTGGSKPSVSPEILFIERSIKWLRPGGRLAIVLPNGILSNPASEYVRWWILQNCFVLASVELPVEAFIFEANVNILTSLLFLQRKTEGQIVDGARGHQPDYPIFMAVAEKVGVDRRGKTIYKRSPNGDEIWGVHTTVSKRRYGDKIVERPVKHRFRTEDNDLPEIAKAYKAFRETYPLVEAGK